MKNPKEEKCTCKEHDPYCCQIHGNCPTCVKKEEPKQENCCTPLGQIKRYEDCYGCDRKPKQEKLTYTESAKKEERISNCTMMKRKQKTVEEAAEYYVKMQYPMGVEKEYPINDFIQGAKWMKERMYSEEEVINAFNEGQALNVRGKLIQGKEWFDQFKKK